MAFDPTPLLSVLQQSGSSSRRDLDTLTSLALQRQRDERRQMDQQQEEQAKFGNEFLGLIAKEGGNVKKAAGLLPPNALPPGRVEAFDELAKIIKKRQKTQEAATGAGASAATQPLLGGALGGHPSREEVLESLRAVETQATGRTTSPSVHLPQQQRTQLLRSGRSMSSFPPEALDALGMVDRQSIVNTREQREKLVKQRAEQVADRFKTSTERRKEFSGLSKDFIEQRNALSRVEASAKDASPAGDLALIFNYMKVLDPGSVVRESEFATAAATGSFGQRIQAAVERVQSGRRLTSQQRQDFLNRARMIFKESQQDHRRLRREFKRLAEREGLDPTDVVLDFTVSPSRLRTAPPPPPAEFPDATFVEWNDEGNPEFITPDGRRFVVEPDRPQRRSRAD